MTVRVVAVVADVDVLMMNCSVVNMFCKLV